MQPTNAESTSPRVFISHSSRDAAVAKLIVSTLEAEGIPCWVAPRNILAGPHYAGSIIDAINTSTILLLLLTEQANTSRHVLAEVERAVHKGLLIIAVRLEEVTLTPSLEFFISAFHWLDATLPPVESHLETIAAAVRQNIAISHGHRRLPPSRPAASRPFLETFSKTGSYTFLVTEIEGSAMHWDTHAQAMAAAVAPFNASLREIIKEHDGDVFKTINEVSYAVFRHAGDAIPAALAAQQQLVAHEGLLPGGLRARMAIHAGVVSYRDGDFFGPCLNLLKKIVDAGHGGQTLVSEAVMHLAPHLPDDATLRDLGTHRLKDIAQPQHLFQLVHPALRSEFPPLQTSVPTIHNLPLQLSAFVGRKKLLSDLEILLQKARLVTVVGVAGMGKSRLAIQAGARAASNYEDGVYFVSFAALTDGSLVAQAVTAALGVREDPRVTPEKTLVDTLRSRHALLLLDNCERLAGEVARLSGTLLQACPRLSIIATSQEPLEIEGGRRLSVAPLTTPLPAGETPDDAWLQATSENESVCLFVERAESASSTFALDAENAQTIARICRRLDGIPLAIELAAARVNVLTVRQIDERLETDAGLDEVLTGGSGQALSRHRTLQAALGWSYDLLTEDERHLFRAVSVFQGGWTLEAVEAVCRPEAKTGAGPVAVQGPTILDLLGRLVDKSLALSREDKSGRRYGQLETLLAYGRKRLKATNDGDRLRERHARFFLESAERIAGDLFGPRHVAALNLLEADHDNFRAALSWCASQPGAAGDGLRLGAALWQFWAGRGHIVEGRRRLADLLRRDLLPTQYRADALFGAASLARLQGDLHTACEGFEESLEISEKLGYDEGRAWATGGLGGVARDRGQWADARKLLDRSLDLHRRLGNRRGEAMALNGRGILGLRQGQDAETQIWFEEGLSLFRQIGDSQGMALALNNLGILAHKRSDLVGARADYHESHALQEVLGDRRGTADTLHNLGVVELALGNADEAKLYQQESLSRSREVGDIRAVAAATNSLADIALDQSDFPLAARLYRDCLRTYQDAEQLHNIPYALEGLAFVAGRRSDWERAARLLGAAESLRRTTAESTSTGDAERIAALTREGRTAFPDFDACHQHGAAWPLDQAVQSALSSSG